MRKCYDPTMWLGAGEGGENIYISKYINIYLYLKGNIMKC